MREPTIEEVKKLGKLTKVILVHENGNLFVDGKEATKWKGAVDSAAVLAHVHGAGFPDLKWQFEPKE